MLSLVYAVRSDLLDMEECIGLVEGLRTPNIINVRSAKGCEIEVYFMAVLIDEQSTATCLLAKGCQEKGGEL